MENLRSAFNALIAVAFLAIGLAQAPQALAATVAAKGAGVKVFSEASDKSPVVKELGDGESLACGERKGMFWEVKLPDGKSGFVSVLKVNRKTEDGGAGLANAIRKAVKEGREEDEASGSRSRSAVMGVRGLGPSDTAAAASNVRPNLRMVYGMEDRQVAPDKVTDLGNSIAAEIEKKAAGK